MMLLVNNVYVHFRDVCLLIIAKKTAIQIIAELTQSSAGDIDVDCL